MPFFLNESQGKLFMIHTECPLNSTQNIIGIKEFFATNYRKIKDDLTNFRHSKGCSQPKVSG